MLVKARETIQINNKNINKLLLRLNIRSRTYTKKNREPNMVPCSFNYYLTFIYQPATLASEKP